MSDEGKTPKKRKTAKSSPIMGEAAEDAGPIRPGRDIDLPEDLPVIGLDNFVLFAFMIAPLIVGKNEAGALIDDALSGRRLVGVFLKKTPEKGEVFDNLHKTGTVATILKMWPMAGDSVRLLIHGIERVRIVEEVAEEPYLKARVVKAPDRGARGRSIDAMVTQIQTLIRRIVEMGNLPEDMGVAVMGLNDPGKLSDLVTGNLSLKTAERQQILETDDTEERLREVLKLLTREIDLMQLGSEIQNKVQSKIDKSQREYLLREQLAAIKKELGEEEDKNPDLVELAEAIKNAQMPQKPREAAEKELGRLEVMHPSSAEYSVSRTYVDWLVSLPWAKSTPDNMDIHKAREILDEDHYNLTEVKERILEYLAVVKLKKSIRGPILCFVGPPGVGKTSLGRSIARALGRKFARISLGGMRDEAEIRGHRRTYIGSMPGRIIKEIRDCASNNPLIMLDEIDKLGSDFRGDPASALLEVLDPEQNAFFGDHYLDVPFDLSNTMFITTANQLDPIPAPLLDRMEVLKLSGYSTREKVEIARRYLVPRAYENTGVSADNVRFAEKGLTTLVEEYTREAGVRNLEREIYNICRKVAKRIALGQKKSVHVMPREVNDLLGPTRIFRDYASRMGQSGVAVGLAWTPSGGETLFIEASAVPGSGQLLLTGQLGGVMKESAMAAHNFLHSQAEQLRIPEEKFSQQNIHLHIPAGSTPKDGPSAGVAMAAALCSLLNGQAIRDSLAMTGEITLKGNILPVGGIKEKVLAARRSGVKELILPAHNRQEYERDVPREVRRTIECHFVSRVEEALQFAFPKMSRDQKPASSRDSRQREQRDTRESDSRQGESRPSDSRPGETRQTDSRPSDSRRRGGRQGDGRKETPKPEPTEPRQTESRQAEPRQAEPRRREPRRSRPEPVEKPKPKPTGLGTARPTTVEIAPDAQPSLKIEPAKPAKSAPARRRKPRAVAAKATTNASAAKTETTAEDAKAKTEADAKSKAEAPAVMAKPAAARRPRRRVAAAKSETTAAEVKAETSAADAKAETGAAAAKAETDETPKKPVRRRRKSTRTAAPAKSKKEKPSGDEG